VDRARRHVRRSKGPPEIGHGRGRADGILEEAAEGRLSDRTETDHRRRVVERAVERAIHGHCTTIVLDLGVLDEIGVDASEFRKIWNLWEGDWERRKAHVVRAVRLHLDSTTNGSRLCGDLGIWAVQVTLRRVGSKVGRVRSKVGRYLAYQQGTFGMSSMRVGARRESRSAYQEYIVDHVGADLFDEPGRRVLNAL